MGLYIPRNHTTPVSCIYSKGAGTYAFFDRFSSLRLITLANLSVVRRKFSGYRHARINVGINMGWSAGRYIEGLVVQQLTDV